MAGKPPADPTLFRGFLTGNAFQTKKGAKGVRLDSLWSRQMIESVVTDDEELAAVALQSCIADEEAVVEGGDEGSPFFIGNYGFYTENAFDTQGKVLQEHERVINEGREYLSDKEWRAVDGKLRRIAQHSNPRLRKAIRGDTLPMLAGRSRAFCVGSFLFSRSETCDALTQNEDGETLKDVLREYNIIATDELLELNKDIEKSMKGILLPSTAEHFLKTVDKLMTEQRNLQNMLRLIVNNLTRRLQLIEKQKWELKKATLRKQSLDFDTMQSIAQESTAHDHIMLYNELVDFVNQRIARQKVVMEKNDLKRIVTEQQELLVRVKPAAAVTEEMFGRKSNVGDEEEEEDTRTITSSIVAGDSISANYSDVVDMASVASVEKQVRDILAEQLISIEEEKERRHNERLLAAENASSKFYLTHNYLEGGHKIFEATEAVVPHTDKHIPAAFVKVSAPEETILYK